MVVNPAIDGSWSSKVSNFRSKRIGTLIDLTSLPETIYKLTFTYNCHILEQFSLLPPRRLNTHSSSNPAYKKAGCWRIKILTPEWHRVGTTGQPYHGVDDVADYFLQTH
ncbi:hypothetical protein MKW98_018373 [Papaver atlanticum]|uniref:Uncharacterized protein n=1 Tax=Papaver atlanticum TaxID=357466 RepID=A0AAD4T3H5_9MAGN|nr:hypothetical protein MKW98_018373 [Papaver atlanticum]